MIEEIFFSEKAYIGFFWLIIALIFLFAELSVPGLFLFIAFACGAVTTAIFAFFDIAFFLQCLIFIGAFAVFFLILRFFIKYKESKIVNTNIYSLKGKKGLVIKDIEENGKGLVKIGGEIWTAQAFEGKFIKKDLVVHIVSVEGSKLIVK